MKFFCKRKKLALGIFAMVLCAVAWAICGRLSSENVQEDTNQDAVLYYAAIKDAANFTAERICPLVVIDKNSDDVIWDDDTSKVLMATFHNVPEVYVLNHRLILDRHVWVVSAKELMDWFSEHSEESWDWAVRLKQLLGMPQYSSVSYFSLLWVKPENVIRPAYLTDVKNGVMKILPDSVGADLDSANREWYADWFRENEIKSYDENGYPWTRLGYTYDWGRKDGSRYGLSEFLILSGSKVSVELTKNVASFVRWMSGQ